MKFLLCLVLTLPIFEVGGEGTYDAIGFPICVLYRTEDAIVHMPAFRCSAWVEERYLFTKRTITSSIFIKGLIFIFKLQFFKYVFNSGFAGFLVCAIVAATALVITPTGKVRGGIIILIIRNAI